MSISLNLGRAMNNRDKSPQSRLRREKRPRVNITYTVETYGTFIEKSLPFVVGVLANFSGDKDKSGPLRDRQFCNVDIDNFSEILARIQPSLLLKLDNELTARLKFSCLSDFSPAGLIAQVPQLNRILKARAELLALTDIDPQYVDIILNRHSLETLNIDKSKRQVESTLESLERILSDSLLAIIQHPSFRALEATWRALWDLVVRTETGEELRIELLDISKKELRRDLEKAANYDQSYIYNKIVENRYGTFGGEPFSVLVGNFEFSNHPQDIKLLRNIAMVAAEAHSPFIAAASAQLFGLDDFADLTGIRNISALLQTEEWAPWRSFRESEDSRWVALTIPQFLLRTPYHFRSKEAHPFSFFEDVPDTRYFLWGNAAFALAMCMTRAFAEENWVSNITGWYGGRVSDLPLAIVNRDDGMYEKTCISMDISDRLEATLSDLGFAALCRVKSGDEAVFFTVPSCHKPTKYESVEATGNARILSTIPALMVCARFAQYLKVISRDYIGSFRVRADYETLFNRWLEKYTSHEPVDSGEDRAKFPLREGQVSVIELPGQPGAYQAIMYLRPQYGMEGLNVSFRLSFRL